MEVGGQRHAPSALPPDERYGVHCTGSWIGPREDLEVLEKRKLSYL